MSFSLPQCFEPVKIQIQRLHSDILFKTTYPYLPSLIAKVEEKILLRQAIQYDLFCKDPANPMTMPCCFLVAKLIRLAWK